MQLFHLDVLRKNSYYSQGSTGNNPITIGSRSTRQIKNIMIDAQNIAEKNRKQNQTKLYELQRALEAERFPDKRFTLTQELKKHQQQLSTKLTPSTNPHYGSFFFPEFEFIGLKNGYKYETQDLAAFLLGGIENKRTFKLTSEIEFYNDPSELSYDNKHTIDELAILTLNGYKPTKFIEEQGLKVIYLTPPIEKVEIKIPLFNTLSNKENLFQRKILFNKFCEEAAKLDLISEKPVIGFK